MFRRRFRPLRPNRGAFQPVQRAVHLLSAGQPGEAAVIFAGLASRLETSQPHRAANLHAQAAHAYAEAQDAASALGQARAALSLYRQFQLEARFAQFYGNLTRKLRSKGMAEAAETLQAEFGGGLEVKLPLPGAKHPGHLPVACSQCGGPIHPDEADWIDEQTVECVYCGALIRAE